ncbi:MAG TPA: phosphate ABC transporter substrate-binding protein PstS [Vicinamibacterales bacterium]|nr:phosphate ABC transporter substrate-binding protein PstS [Vicinamibacterales bacterium]
MTKAWQRGIAVAAMGATALLAAWSSAPVVGAQGATTLTGAGSTFINPLLSRWSKEYNTLHPDVRINYQSIGSGGGRQQFLAKTVAFGASDAPLTDEQLAQGGGETAIVHVPMTQGSVVIAYNLQGLPSAIKFSPATIAGMYLGTIKMWNDPTIAADNPGLTLPRRPVLVVHRSDGSGTTDIFTDYLSKVSPEWKDKVGHGTSVQWPVGIGGQGNEGVANQVRNTVGGVGYMELAYARQNNIPYGPVKNRAGNYVDPSPANVTNAASSLASLPADLRFSITDQPGPQAYPIAGTTWVLLYRKQDDPKVGRLVTEFASWAIHDGQRYANELDYAALAPNLVQKADAALHSITCGSSPCLSK